MPTVRTTAGRPFSLVSLGIVDHTYLLTSATMAATRSRALLKVRLGIGGGKPKIAFTRRAE